MYSALAEINARPEVFGQYTADALWTDEYRSKQMLSYHLNEGIDVSSRNLEFIETSSTWIAEHFRLGPGKSVCDFGCGPGLYTSRFAETGARVTGLDFSKSSVDYARDQASKSRKSINYIHANYLEFRPSERFDLITMIMYDYCALSPNQRGKLLRCFHDCLGEDGTILLDVYSMVAYESRKETGFYEYNQLNHFWCDEDYYCFVNTYKYDKDAVVLDKYSIFPESGGTETVYNWLQYFTPESLSEELSEAGFEVTQIYKDVCGRPFSDLHPEFAIEARKNAPPP